MATTQRANTALWVVQGVLTCSFVFAGAVKLFAPLQMLQGPVSFPGWFYRFLGFAELCGALGLVLPGAFRIQRALTPIAALGLTLIVTGATVITFGDRSRCRHRAQCLSSRPSSPRPSPTAGATGCRLPGSSCVTGRSPVSPTSCQA